MKKILATILILALALATLTGCGWVRRAMTGGVPFTGKLYDVDDRADLDIDGVSRIEIGAVSDRVTILSGGGKLTAELKGQCRSATEPVKLDAIRQGDAILIEVVYPLSPSQNNTDLTVTIPEGYAGGLKAETVSGDIEADDLPFALGKVELGTISGAIRFGAEGFESMDAHTTSGAIDLRGINGRTGIGTVSGEVRLQYAKFAATTVHTISGGVTAIIPADAAFGVRFDSVSGRFRSSHPSVNVESSGGSFSTKAAGGGETIEVTTTSGGFTVEE